MARRLQKILALALVVFLSCALIASVVWACTSVVYAAPMVPAGKMQILPYRVPSSAAQSL